MAKLSNLVELGKVLVDPDILQLYGNETALEDTNGYITIQFTRKRKPRRRELLHRLVLHGDEIIHHINNIKTDNRRCNLLATTQSINLLLKRTPTDNTTRGVRLHKQSGLYQARITFKKKEISLGYYKTHDEARSAYLTGYAKLVGDELEGNIK